MRHHDRNRKLGREKRQRSVLIRNLARSLILNEGITTTAAKAKALRSFVERLVTRAKKNTLASTRTIETRLRPPETDKELKELATRYGKRAGGYTRIVRLGRGGKRVGEMSRIEFIK